jgi:hypothetical protein
MGIFSNKEKSKSYNGKIVWEKLGSIGGPDEAYRSKVPGGWIFSSVFILAGESAGVTFIPDPEHKWDGNSLE